MMKGLSLLAMSAIVAMILLVTEIHGKENPPSLTKSEKGRTFLCN